MPGKVAPADGNCAPRCPVQKRCTVRLVFSRLTRWRFLPFVFSAPSIQRCMSFTPPIPSLLYFVMPGNTGPRPLLFITPACVVCWFSYVRVLSLAPFQCARDPEGLLRHSTDSRWCFLHICYHEGACFPEARSNRRR